MEEELTISTSDSGEPGDLLLLQTETQKHTMKEAELAPQLSRPGSARPHLLWSDHPRLFEL